MSLVSWLDRQPVILVLLGLVAVFLALAIGLSYLTERIFEPEDRSRTSGSMATAVGVIAGLYAVLTTFVIVNEWQAYNDAQSKVSDESAALSDAFAKASVFPDAQRVPIQTAVLAYDRSVVCSEIPYLASHEGPAATTRAALAQLYQTVDRNRPPGQTEFYNGVIGAVSDITRARRARINSALTSIPDLLLIAIVLTSLVLLGTVSALDTQHRRWHIVITTALAVIVAINLMVVISLSRPFDGTATVSDSPLREGVPAALLSCK
jgi:hypothetical protein